MARRSEDLRPPLVSAPDLPPHLESAAPKRGADLQASRIELTGDADLSHSTLDQCVLTGSAGALELRGATLMDVDLQNVQVTTLAAREANLRRVRITGGRIGTLDLTDARIHELELQGVRIDYLTLAGAKAVDVLVEHCQITTLDLPGSTLTRMAFEGTRCDALGTRGMRAEHVDLRGLDALAFLDVSSLRGTTLTMAQVEQLAPVFAASAGISVRD
ncbi:pentapeptide repeat-containing protein [uncultured Microbacterium sp.]|uniref:pentapeptide repeat-containing protein n=1 Tax=uncultured Microbacterium sp. TaxID=191216 RepID=UPI002625B13B|nr:pentapeptide repeat-containing protein [uncultured Microbacterium sp.]